ncbi:hypothetical protein EYF80_036529 [Liparis tanakae]|uniref:Uncharacterized protein n=1 Tax=Liparis tanakae TaxID=230148 RepID=A0A4Z2GI61_9TELE|nr:hypothetical protein EYF80_036529 [Liparis tanakae]
MTLSHELSYRNPFVLVDLIFRSLKESTSDFGERRGRLTYLDPSHPELGQGSAHLGSCRLQVLPAGDDLHQQGVVVRRNDGALEGGGAVQTDAHALAGTEDLEGTEQRRPETDEKEEDEETSGVEDQRERSLGTGRLDGSKALGRRAERGRDGLANTTTYGGPGGLDGKDE